MCGGYAVTINTIVGTVQLTHRYEGQLRGKIGLSIVVVRNV